MYRRGIVAELDTETHRVRVRFPESQGLLSPWLNVLVGSVSVDRQHGLPSLEDQVACLLDERGETGCVLGALYSGEVAPPGDSDTKRGWHFGDGGRVEYDRATGVLTVIAPDTVAVTGDVSIAGELQVGGGAEFVALADKVLQQLQALANWATTHAHAGVTPGGGASGPPAAPPTPPASVASTVTRSD